MTWPLAVTVLGCLAALVALAHVALPYLRKRSDAEVRLQALEAANVSLSDRIAHVEQFTAGGGSLGVLRRAAR